MKYDLIAGGFVINRDYRVLLVDHKKLGVWLPFGGHVESGESPHDALIRECREELPGLELKFLQSTKYNVPLNFNVHVHDMPADNTTREPHKHCCINYVCTTDSSAFTFNRAELNGFKWFDYHSIRTCDRIPDNIKEFSLEAQKIGSKILSNFRFQ